jgi:drug/metabolite transporter superfamily protein YnfA
MTGAAESLKIGGLFFLSGLAEIGGGWLVWQACREGKPWWWAFIGSLVLVCYGFTPTLQPIDDFGRLYAIYGGIFIGMAFAWGRIFDGQKLDKGDIIGSVIAFIGVAIVLFWPREGSNDDDDNKELSYGALEEEPGIQSSTEEASM